MLLDGLASRIVEGSSPATEVGAGTEGATRAGDDHHPYVVVGIRLIERLDQLAHHAGGEGVEPLRTMEREPQNAVAHLVADGFEAHAAAAGLSS